MKKQITIIYLLSLVFLMLPNISRATIIFEDNFNNSPDWQSNQTVGLSGGGTSRSWSSTRSDTCTTYCPPQGWTSYRAAPSLWDDDRRLDTYILDADGKRGATGKGITYNVEVSGYFGTWSGGSIDLWLGEQGYNELYVRYYLKFGTGWEWSNPENSEKSLFKFLRISTFNDNIWTTTANPQEFFLAGLNRPLCTPLANHINGQDYTATSVDLRFAPDYIGYSDYYSSAQQPTDGEWHSYEFYVKMNTTPGTADGKYRLYIDGAQQYERNDVEWQEAGADTSHKWNWLMLIDNASNASAPLNDHVEMPLYMDDVVVSTEYVGPDYIIDNGHSDTNAPSAPTGLGVL